MKTTFRVFTTASAIGIVLASLMVGQAFAWHPQGAIQKFVQNETTNGTQSDANDSASAVAAHPGDTLKYVITVSNKAAAANNGDNDMAKTVMTDTLPDGVQLVSNPTQTNISVDMGTITPGQSVSKSYEVKVTATKESVITNKACFTGNSLANDNAQSGCDVAVVTVKVPTPTPIPTPTPTPTPTPAPTTTGTGAAAVTVLPDTGASNVIVPAVVVSILGYAGYLLRLKRQTA